jgi:uncharacterized cupin superfamily protein
MDLLARVTQEGVVPEVERPAPEKVLAGDPVHTTWSLEERGHIYSGMWQSTPGKWRVSYGAGDSWVIRPGFTGTWEVVETTLKDYVIITG